MHEIRNDPNKRSTSRTPFLRFQIQRVRIIDRTLDFSYWHTHLLRRKAPADKFASAVLFSFGGASAVLSTKKTKDRCGCGPARARFTATKGRRSAPWPRSRGPSLFGEDLAAAMELKPGAERS